MTIQSNCDVTMRGNMNGQVCSTKLNYFSDSLVTKDAAGSATAFRDKIWAALKTIISSLYTLEQITVSEGHIGDGNKDEYVLVVNEDGDLSALNVMPVWTTAVIWKRPDNTTIAPPGEPNFGNSRNGFSGILESDQDGGLLTPGAISAWDAFGEEMEDFANATTTWLLGIHREVAGQGGTNANVYVEETYAGQKLGSQLSRKY